MLGSEHVDALEERATLSEFKDAVERLNNHCTKAIPESIQRRLFGLFERVVRGTTLDASSDDDEDDDHGDADERRKAWEETKGISKLDAMREYIDICEDYAPFQEEDHHVDELPKEIQDQLKNKLNIAAAASSVALEASDIFEAARKGVSFEMFSSENVNDADESGATPLMHAADAEQVNTVRHLLSAFGKTLLLDMTDADGSTALHYAAIVDCGAIVRLLLDAGASREIKDTDGMTPREVAASSRCDEAVKAFGDA